MPPEESQNGSSMGMTGLMKQFANLGAAAVLAGLLVFLVAYQHPKESKEQREFFLKEVQEQRQAYREDIKTLVLSIDNLADAIRRNQITEVVPE